MCASTETDVRESASYCTLASGEGLSSGGETSHPMSLKRPFPHPGNALYMMLGNNSSSACSSYIMLRGLLF
jgi:hypothetical protein